MVKANWHVDCYEQKRVTRFFGHYQYQLLEQNKKLLIAKKTSC